MMQPGRKVLVRCETGVRAATISSRSLTFSDEHKVVVEYPDGTTEAVDARRVEPVPIRAPPPRPLRDLTIRPWTVAVYVSNSHCTRCGGWLPGDEVGTTELEDLTAALRRHGLPNPLTPENFAYALKMMYASPEFTDRLINESVKALHQSHLTGTGVIDTRDLIDD